MRFEYKYIVHESKLDRLRELVLPYLNVDKFAEIGGGTNQYTVRSIYFDSPQFDCYFEKVEGIKNRKKLRLRGYNQGNVESNVFLEIKRKYEVPILKYRSILKYGDALKMFGDSHINGYLHPNQQHPKSYENAQRFLFHIYSKNMQPVVLITYEREAYLYKFDKTVRVTFDKNLRGMAYPALNEIYTEKGLSRSLPGHFILEIKFNDHFPLWMNPIISSLGLVRRAASKYTITMDTNKVVGKRLTKSSIYTRSNWSVNNN